MYLLKQSTFVYSCYIDIAICYSVSLFSKYHFHILIGLKNRITYIFSIYPYHQLKYFPYV